MSFTIENENKIECPFLMRKSSVNIKDLPHIFTLKELALEFAHLFYHLLHRFGTISLIYSSRNRLHGELLFLG